MTVWLGDMDVSDVESRLGITFSDEVRSELTAMIQHQVSDRDVTVDVKIADGKIHIFDIPFCLAAGSRATLRRVLELLKPYAKMKMKDTMQAVIFDDPNGAKEVAREMKEEEDARKTPEQKCRESIDLCKRIIRDYPDLRGIELRSMLNEYRRYHGIIDWSYRLGGNGWQEFFAAYPYVNYRMLSERTVFRWHIGKKEAAK